jgi:hypothetical protein
VKLIGGDGKENREGFDVPVVVKTPFRDPEGLHPKLDVHVHVERPLVTVD